MVAKIPPDSISRKLHQTSTVLQKKAGELLSVCTPPAAAEVSWNSNLQQKAPTPSQLPGVPPPNMSTCSVGRRTQ